MNAGRHAVAIRPKAPGTQALIPLLILAILLCMYLIEPRFYSRLNMSNVLRNFSIAALAALGQMLVMIVGGFDLSVGAVIALASVVAASSMAAVTHILPTQDVLVAAAGVSAALLSGVAVGLINRAMVASLRISPFMSTLAIGSMVLGAAFYFTKGVPVYGMPEVFTELVGRGAWGGLPTALWIALFLGVVVWGLVEHTRLGRHLLAAGGNLAAARASRVGVSATLMTAYASSGVLAAVVGLLLTARIGSGQSTWAQRRQFNPLPRA